MKLNYKQTVLIGFAFMSILAFWQFYDQVIPYILESRFGLNTFVTNAVMSIDNVLALFMLPLFGALSDKTNTKLGKRTPYILFGTIAASILLIVLAYFESKLFFTGFMITLIILLVAMSTYRSPAVAYMPDVTEKPLRSKGNAIINLVGYIGVDLLKFTCTPLPEKPAFMLISVLVMTLFVKENRLRHVEDGNIELQSGKSGRSLSRGEKTSFILILISVFLWFCSYNAVTTAFSRYCVNVWGVSVGKSSGYLLLATVAAIAAFLPLGFLSSRLGRKKTVLIGIALMTVCFAAAGFIRSETPAMYAIFALVGVGWAAINVNSYPMAVEIGSVGDTGKYTGLYYTFSMAAQIATPLLSGLIITKTDWGYSALFPYAVIFAAASFVTMSFVRHGDYKPGFENAVMENLSGGDD